MDRKNKPATLPVSSKTTSLPQATINLKDNVLTATLPTNDSVTIHLYGATVVSWKTSSGTERLWLSTAAKLDGSKPIRGGIPLVFPVFGAPPKDHHTSKLPQHGFARNNVWEYLGSSRTEGPAGGDQSVKLDFGLSRAMLDKASAGLWDNDFGLVYSVELGQGRLATRMRVQNEGQKGWEFQCLFHTYLRVKDISTVTVSGLKGAPYVDKVRSAQKFTESSSLLSISSETDRVYTPPTTGETDTPVPITVLQAGKPLFDVNRDSLPDVTVWNPWIDKANAMGDFAPKDGYKDMLCIEPGAVSGWVKLDAGEAWEGGQVIEAHE